MEIPFRIIPTKEKYLEQIVPLANSYQINRLTESEINMHGFLVSGYNYKEYLAYLENTKYFYLCVYDGVVVGFILAYNDCNIQESEWLNMKIKAYENRPFVLIKQICVAKENLGKGIAKKLYEYLFEQIKQLVSYAVIVTEPLNIPSINFHEKLGFKKQFEETPPDGLKRGVWKRISK
ncbi:MAG: hypothetical protein DRJ07_04820 [Bacteroidetes bacterium]|nr:MAG: hypothetical protein DRJ07_04820 [Bacteroidota bacterium]